MTHLGLIGLGTMGENLVRNIVSKDASIVVWNRTIEKVTTLQSEIGNGVIVGDTIEDLISQTESPRSIFLLVPAGKATDEVAQKLFELLSPGDAIWDLGNAHWDTTLAHQSESKMHGIHWIGCGISGGSEGARLGPSMMPGGDRESVENMLPILEKISAKDFSGRPCVTYVGAGAAGNFVKMVHNGIEYAIMQGIAEIYDALRSEGQSAASLQSIFHEINDGLLKSFLLDITEDILETRDPRSPEDFLLEKISDKAGSKGTGGWTVEAALKLGVPVPTIAESLFARWMSGREHRVGISQASGVSAQAEARLSAPLLRQGLKVAYLASYIQGIELILRAEQEWKWGINIDEVLRIWQGGCIIRSEMLRALPDFYRSHTDTISTDIPALLADTGDLLSMITSPAPVLSSAYNYLQTLRATHLPTNLIQAMRDHFGDHTVRRIGSDEAENFEWGNSERH